MDLRLLGPLDVRDDHGAPVVLSAPKLRAVLSVLALEPGHVVPTDRLIEDVWDHDPPARALVSLRAYVSNLRRAVARHDGRPVIVTRGRGYVLDLDPDELDTVRFERALVEAQRCAADEPVTALTLLDEALASWRGPALTDIAHLVVAAAPIARLEKLRASAREDRLSVLLGLGEHHRVVVDAEELVARAPLEERPRRLLALALHRSGRTPEALAVHRDFRALLADELGLDPSPAFEELAGQLLRHDPALGGVSPTSRRAAVTRAPASTVTDVAARAATPDAPRWASALGAVVVGRRSERARLTATVDRLVASGTGGVVAIAGEAGIGKSSLVAVTALHATTFGVPVALGRCSETPGAPPFWAWTQVLADLHALVDEVAWREAVAAHAETLHPLVPSLLPWCQPAAAPVAPTAPSDAHAARFALHRAVAEVLRRLARPRGLVVAIDDLHWADTASAELTAHLATVAPDVRLLLLTTYRDTAADASPELAVALAGVLRQPNRVQVDVGGLARDEVGELLDGLLAGDEVRVDTARVHERTGGNPFHVRQLAEVARDGGDVESVPAGVRQVLVERLDRVDPAVRAALDALAVLGQTADPMLVSRVADQCVLDTLAHLDTAARDDLVQPGAPREPVRFAHALVRETVLAELPLRRLVDLHARAGEILQTFAEVAVEEVAEHFWQAADVVGIERAVDALVAAATAAHQVFAAERAEELLRKALRLLDHGDEHTARSELAVRVQLVTVLKGVHGWTAEVLLDALAAVRSLATRLGAAAELMPMWWGLWALHMTRGDLDEAMVLAEQLLASADDAEPQTLVAGHVAVGYTSLFRGVDTAVVLDHVRDAADARHRSRPAALDAVPEHLGITVEITRALAHALRGEAHASLAAAEAAVAMAQRVGDPFRLGYARLFAAWSASLLDLPAIAAAHGDAGVVVCEEAKLPAIVALIEPNRTWAHVRLGEDPAPWIAIARATDAALVAAGQRHAVPHGRLLLAEAQACAGDPVAAATTLAAAHAIGEEIGEQVYAAQFARVESVLAGGPTTRALAAHPEPRV